MTTLEHGKHFSKAGAEAATLGKRVGFAVKRIREYRSMSQKQLADLCGFSQSTISALENGRKANSLKLLYAVGSCLDCQPNRLLELAFMGELEERFLSEKMQEGLESAEKEPTLSLDELKVSVDL
ncbi:MAG: helix-turn-helix domain-containing protein [Nitrospiraceae bacterium]|nr:helix-turn-helix domain-containing protein [Nitrospiraceae bacterium]